MLSASPARPCTTTSPSLRLPGGSLVMTAEESRCWRKGVMVRNTLKGSTRYFGATRVSEMAHQLESMGSLQQLTYARDALRDVEREMASLTPLLLDYMRGRVSLDP